ncbi:MULTISPECIES: winged helix-turn-helix transcriptional regulator [unclassified Micromonospora]|uniref:winged helix-turn-helix transcriptional regulator n=1 Tax=unclassified Micromonospora TaxID=2617518 RepID=UPI003A840DBC
MLGRMYDSQTCPVARALEVVGERWTILIVRDALFGTTRFDDFRANLGVARNVLSNRLQTLVEADVLDRVAYQQRPPRYEYQLTERGRALAPVVMSLMDWGTQQLGADGPGRALTHHGCGGRAQVQVGCSRCAERLDSRQIDTRPTGRPAPDR